MANTDPASMTDEELEAALANPPEETPAEEEPVEPETPAEEPETPVAGEEPEEEEEPVAPPPSRREQLRINQLLEKMRESKPEPKTPTVTGAIDYEKTLDADPELIKKLQDDRTAAIQAGWNQGAEQVKTIQFHTRLEVDAPRVEAKYPQLDKDSEGFNPQLAMAINTMYLTTVGYDASSDTVRDPSLRYSDYVNSIFELAGEIGAQSTEATRTNIKKTAAKTGLRPDGSSAKKMNLNKPPEQMTDEELDAVIGMAIPKR